MIYVILIILIVLVLFLCVRVFMIKREMRRITSEMRSKDTLKKEISSKPLKQSAIFSRLSESLSSSGIGSLPTSSSVPKPA